MHEQLKKIRQQTLERIEELTAQPKPSYTIDGQSVSWTEYLRQLQETVRWCETMIVAQKPCEIVSQGMA